jgi:predicted dehydrogenase
MLGTVVQAQIEYVRRYDKQGPFCDPDLKKDMDPPADLDWNAWLGPVPARPWNPHHYFEWRNYAAYSGGIATDLFIHRLTRIMKACDLSYPRRVVGMGGIWQWPDGRDLPDNFEMICEYPRGMTVYALGTLSNRVGVDHLIRGYRGTLYFTPEGWVAKDKDDKVLAEHRKTGAEDIHLHHTNLHNHLRNGEPLSCPVELGMAGVAAVVMANESWRSGQMMAWDEANEKMVPASTLGEQNHFPDSTSSETTPKVAG